MCLSIYNCILNIYPIQNYFSPKKPKIHFRTNGKLSDSLSFSPFELVRYILYTWSNVNNVLCFHRIRWTLPAILRMLKFQITNQSILLIKVDKKGKHIYLLAFQSFFKFHFYYYYFFVLIFFIITF